MGLERLDLRVKSSVLLEEAFRVAALEFEILDDFEETVVLLVDVVELGLKLGDGGGVLGGDEI